MRSIVAVIVVAMLCVPLLSAPRPGGAVSAGTPPPPERVTTSSEEGLERLAPDLQAAARTAAQSRAASAPLIVTVMIDPEASGRVQSLLDFPALSRVVAGVRWVTGEIDPRRLVKLSGLAGVRLVFSAETFQTAEAPGLSELRSLSPLPDLRAAAQLAASGDLTALRDLLESARQSAVPRVPTDRARTNPAPAAAGGPLTPAQVHGAPAVHARGLRGENVTVALVDTGVDFGHPDLVGTQAVVPSGPYAGWPFAYDALSGYYYASRNGYALDPLEKAGRLGHTNYTAAVPVPAPACANGECSAVLTYGSGLLPISMRWPDHSRSGQYYYAILPDYALIWLSYYGSLGYPNGVFIPPLLIVSDEVSAGVYDAVYADIDFDGLLTASERLSKTTPTTGADIDGDGVWDLSTGLLTWISDGANHPPGVAQLYPQTAAQPVPPAGRLLTFINDDAGHGTSCAGQIAAQSVITDPQRKGPANPLLSGPLLSGIAPAARIAAFQNGFDYPLDSWTLAALGFDGLPQSGDEAQIVSNSWGTSAVVADGWDEVSRFAAALNLVPDEQTGRPLAEQVTFIAATGNGGHGYGTVTSPNGATILDIGASTLYGSVNSFENVDLDQFVYGEIQPWSNRGPGGLGDMAPDLSAVGAWGSAPLPLNLFINPDGESAYDVFGGTSMSTPLAAGGAALVYQAFRQRHGRWPTWSETRDLLLSGAQELGYEPSVQGAGDMRADRSVQAVFDQAARLNPAEWTPGAYRGQVYPAYPRVLVPGETAAQQFTLSNPGSQALLDVPLSAVRLERVHEETFTIPYTPPTSDYRSNWPLYLEDLRSVLQNYPADLVRAQLVMPYTSFDAGEDYYEDHWWQIALYDWTDRDGDGRLWQDANRDGQVQMEEMDGTASGALSEINRFSYGYPTGTIQETSLGRLGLAQVHDGVFLGLSCVFCGNSATLQVRVSFYRYLPWDWVQLSAANVNIPAGGQATFDAELRVPAAAAPGYVEGFLRAELPGGAVTVPLTANIAAAAEPFAVGPGGAAPYTNGNLQGGFSWRWRYESGDWRFFFYDAPAAPPGRYTRGFLDLGWNSARTDLDAFVFGPAAGSLSSAHPAQFGPSGLVEAAASADSHISSGKFRRETATGGPREVLSFDPRPGLNVFAFHQVLSGGDQHAEPYTASVFTLSAFPAPLDWIEPVQLDPVLPPYLSGQRSIQITTSAAIPDGLSVQAYGFSPPIVFHNQIVRQDEPYNLCAVSWLYRPQDGLELLGAGLLDITLTSAQPDLDIDLIVLRDDGDGRYECNQDRLTYYSDGPGAEEHLRVNFPQDGVYWIGVQGVSVPGSNGSPFDAVIRAVQGSGLRLRGVPVGPLAAGQTITLQVDFTQDTLAPTGEPLDGLIYAGLPSVPGLVEIPITLRPAVLLQPPALLSADSASVFAQPVGVRLSFANSGALPETVEAAVLVPPGLDIVPGSLAGPGSPPVYNPLSRGLTWTGPLPAGASVELSFAVAAAAGFSPGPVEFQARVEGQTSGQSWSPRLTLHANQAWYYLPLAGRR